MKEEVARSVLKHLEHAVSNLDKAHAGLGDDADLRGIAMQLQTYSAAITECRTALASSLSCANPAALESSLRCERPPGNCPARACRRGIVCCDGHALSRLLT